MWILLVALHRPLSFAIFLVSILLEFLEFGAMKFVTLLLLLLLLLLVTLRPPLNNSTEHKLSSLTVNIMFARTTLLKEIVPCR